MFVVLFLRTNHFSLATIMSYYLSRYLSGEALHFLVQQNILISCVVARKQQCNVSQGGFVVATMNYASSMRMQTQS